jgi:hypothetical protein
VADLEYRTRRPADSTWSQESGQPGQPVRECLVKRLIDRADERLEVA